MTSTPLRSRRAVTRCGSTVTGSVNCSFNSSWSSSARRRPLCGVCSDTTLSLVPELFALTSSRSASSGLQETGRDTDITRWRVPRWWSSCTCCHKEIYLHPITGSGVNYGLGGWGGVGRPPRKWKDFCHRGESVLDLKMRDVGLYL